MENLSEKIRHLANQWRKMSEKIRHLANQWRKMSDFERVPDIAVYTPRS
jgi:hypothetical protein